MSPAVAPPPRPTRRAAATPRTPARRPSPPEPSAPPAAPAPPYPPQPEGHAAVVIPASAMTYEGFRAWTRSDEFPEQGRRVEFIAGDIYVDFMAERLGGHVLPKGEITRVLANRAKATGAGRAFSDGVRYALTGAVASFEPDVSFVANDTFTEGRIERMPTADGEDTIELAGPPDLVVEVVSPSSVRKDTDRLPAECFAGGVREYWLVDCRGDDLIFTVFTRGMTAFEPVDADDDFAASAVLGKSYRLTRTRGPLGDWDYELQER